ncbi:hypothetical protein BDD12DRAFT_801582 [Trichophaea hybrida]|nr:hypothetical protein BDD12DRAFT_801582 [Trichophaea hybrida]
MARVTRSSKKPAPAVQAEPEPERNALHVIDNNSTPEVEQPVEVPPAKKSTRAKKGKENSAAKTPAKSKKNKRGKKGAAQKRDVIEDDQEEEVSETIAVAEETETVEEAKLEDVEDTQNEAQAAEHPEEQTLAELVTQEAPVLEEAAPQEEAADEVAEEEIPQEEIPEKEIPREECDTEQPRVEETADLGSSVTLDSEEYPEQQSNVEADQSATPPVEDIQQDADANELQPNDINDDDAAISAELQRMADEMHGSVSLQIDEAAIEAEMERMSQDVQTDVEPQRPQTPERRQTVLRVAKTPKFDPEVHGNDDDFEDPGNDSFELHVSPRKKQVAVPSKELEKTISLTQKLQKTVAKTKKTMTTITTKPKAEKAKTIAPRPSVTVKKTVKPSTTTTTASTSSGTVRAKRPVTTPSSPKVAKRTTSVSSQVSMATIPPKRAPSTSSQASTASTVVIPHSKPRAIGITFPPPPPPIKSSKPPTVSNFELPGEVFARKIQAQKEERRKRMEGEEMKRKEFKARPAPKSTFTKHITQDQQKFVASKRASLAISAGESVSSTPDRSLEETRENTPDIKVPTSAVEKNTSRVIKRPGLMPEVKKPAAGTIRPPQKDQLDRGAQAQAVLKARKEAAERGRQTVKMWAEQQKQKEERAKAAAAAVAARDAAVAVISS